MSAWPMNIAVVFEIGMLSTKLRLLPMKHLCVCVIYKMQLRVGIVQIVKLVYQFITRLIMLVHGISWYIMVYLYLMLFIKQEKIVNRTYT